MVKLKYWFSFVFLFMTLLAFRLSTNYTTISYKTLDWLGQQQFFSACYWLLFVGLFVCFLFGLSKEYTLESYRDSKRFLSFLQDFFLILFFLVVIVFVLPAVIYAHSLVIFTHFFTLFSSEILNVLPDITVNDFFILCVEGPPIESTQIPPMGGHHITAGVHEGKNYVCADLKEMIFKSDLSETGKLGVRGAFRVLGIPDVLCSGVSPDQIPASNQSILTKGK